MAINERTSNRIARKASRLLMRSNSRSVKSVSASALTQARDRKKSKKRK